MRTTNVEVEQPGNRVVNSREPVAVVTKERQIVHEPLYSHKKYLKTLGTVCGSLTWLLSSIAWIVFVAWLFKDPIGGLTGRPSPNDYRYEDQSSNNNDNRYIIGAIGAQGIKDDASDDTDTEIGYFNWHPFLMTTAFLIFAVPAVLTYSICGFLSYTILKSVHGCLNCLSLGFLVAGLAVVIDWKENFDSRAQHFNTLHGTVGLIEFILFVVAALGGVMLYMTSFAEKLRNSLKPFHKRLGFAVLLLGLALILEGSQYYGHSIDTNPAAFDPHWFYLRAIGGLVAFTIVGLIFTVPTFIDKHDPKQIN
jgi:hypothetical protein